MVVSLHAHGQFLDPSVKRPFRSKRMFIVIFEWERRLNLKQLFQTIVRQATVGRGGLGWTRLIDVTPVSYALARRCGPPH